jgi:hypothetical protein
MSTLSKSLMASMGIRQKLKLYRKLPKGGTVATGKHIVRFKADKEITGKEYKLDDGTMKKDYVRYLFEENGEEKIYNAKKFGKDGSLHYFIQHFADIEMGDEVILEGKKSGMINYIDISKVSTGKEVEVSEDEIEESENAEISIE